MCYPIPSAASAHNQVVTTGTGASLPFRFEAVSDARGSLLVDVIDDYTYYMESAPHVTNASVIVQNPYTGSVVAKGVTDEMGIWEMSNMPVGVYRVSVSANKHNEWQKTVEINPQQTVKETVFVSYNAISYSWEVRRTEIEDRYEISLVTDFEANVPAPVIILDFDENWPYLEYGEFFQLNVRVRNEGLIAANKFILSFGGIEGFSYTNLIANVDIPPKSSVEIPVVIKRDNSEKVSSMVLSENVVTAEANPDDPPPLGCHWAKATGCYLYECGFDQQYHRSEKLFWPWAGDKWTVVCPKSDPRPEIVKLDDNRTFDEILQDDPHRKVDPSVGDVGSYILGLLSAFSVIENCLPCSTELYLWALGCAGAPDYSSLVNTLLGPVACLKQGPSLCAEASKYTNLQSVKAYRISSSNNEADSEVVDWLDAWNRLPNSAQGELQELYTCYYPAFILRAVLCLEGDRSSLSNLSDAQMTKWCGYFTDLVNASLSEGEGVSDDEIESLMVFSALLGIGEDDVKYFCERWNRSLNYYRMGVRSISQLTDDLNPDFISEEAIADAEWVAKTSYASVDANNGGIRKAYAEVMSALGDSLSKVNHSVCAKVGLNITQTITMTREAFEGTLALYNGNSTTAMTGVRLDLVITDEEGNVRTDLFEISTKGLDKLTAIDGTGELAPNATGTATILFLPTHDAAPLNSVFYKFGGTLSYIDPFSGERVTVPLYPVQMEVRPSPRLDLHYFLQRDVLGDDPFTADKVEPSVPAEFALLIRNKGCGVAKSVTIDTAQPKIVDNQKGLAIDFALSGSALNGQTRSLGIVSTAIGDIGAQETAIAQWWLTASLQGHFTGVDAKIRALNNSGRPAVSLIDQVVTHELIRSIVADDDGRSDFLVTELNVNDLPDTLYHSDGAVEEVALADAVAQGSVQGLNPSFSISVTAPDDGWCYAELPDPGDGKYAIKRVSREDGSEVPLRNIWMTDRTFPDGADPVVENKLHLVDKLAASGSFTYTVELVALDETPPAVDHFEGVAENALVSAPLESITVFFTEPIDSATLGIGDIEFRLQNLPVALDGVMIEKVDSQCYRIIGLENLTAADGLYQLTVQAAGVTDVFGNPGVAGKRVSWTKAAVAPAVREVSGVVQGAVVKALDTLDVRFTTSLKPDSFCPEKILIQGSAANTVSVTPLDDSETYFRISGLSAYLQTDGPYSLSIDTTALQSQENVAGNTLYQLEWTMDRTAPRVSSVLRQTPSSALTGQFEVLVVFSEAVGPMSLASVVLLHEAVPVPLTEAVTLVRESAERYVIKGLQDVATADGHYEIVIDAAQVADIADNAGVGSCSVSWEKDTIPPASVTGLTIEPDTGISNSDGITSAKNLTLRGILPEDGLTVEISAVYGNGKVTLVSPFSSPSRELNVPVSLTVGGNVALIVRCTDAAELSSETSLSLFVDEMDLGGSISGVPQSLQEQPSELQITLSDDIVESELTASVLGLRRNGSPCDVGSLSVSKVDPRTYRVGGAASIATQEGHYQFFVDLKQLHKLRSGKSGAEVVSAEWDYVPPDTTAPTVVSWVVNGGSPETNYLSIVEIAVTFSEPVNVPELLSNGLLGHAVRLVNVGAQGLGEGAVPSVPSDFTWDAEHNRVIWTISATVPAGQKTLYVDGRLVHDAAGNAVVPAEGAGTTALGLPSFDDPTSFESVAAYAAPVGYDYDKDGLSDLLVGEKADTATGKIRIYRNAGTASLPQYPTFSYLQVNGADLAVPAAYCLGISFCFVDMTGDGLEDLVTGLSDGTIWLYPSTAAQTFSSGICVWRGSDSAAVSARAMVTASDLDEDGQPELVAGGMDGKIAALRYDPVSALCTNVVWLSDVFGIPVQVTAGRSAPSFTDATGDGVAELLTGDTDGNLWLYLADSGSPRNWNPVPLQLLQSRQTALRSRPCWTDVNNDGVPDILLGTADGAVSVCYGTAPINSALSFDVARTLVVSLYTNATSEAGERLSVGVGRPYGKLPQPKREGWDFDGWWSDNRTWGGLQITETTVFEGTITNLYASWVSPATDFVLLTALEEGVPASVTIQRYAGSATNVVVPRVVGNLPVTEIGAGAFAGHADLRSVLLSPNTTVIGAEAFSNCSSLAGITVPNGVQTLGESVFLGCSSLRSVIIGAGVRAIGGRAFADCSALNGIALPNGVTAIGAEVFSGCSALRTAELGSGVTEIPEGGFKNCANLAAFTVGTNVTSIAASAFCGCGALNRMNVPNAVLTIGDSAFKNCSSLAFVTLGSNLVSIGACAFEGCTVNGAVTLPEKLNALGDFAFRACSNLLVVIVNGSLATIGNGAFAACPAMTGVYFKGNAPSAGTDVYVFSTNVTTFVLNGKTGWCNPWQERPLAFWSLPIESTVTTPLPVPSSYLERYPSILFAYNMDYEAAAYATGANGYKVWQSFFLNCDPTDPSSVLTATIRIGADGLPVVGWRPDAPGHESAYVVEGKVSLSDPEWQPVTAAHRFFRIRVVFPAAP